MQKSASITLADLVLYIYEKGENKFIQRKKDTTYDP